MRDQLLTQAKRIVIKIGSSLIASRETGLSAEQIARLASEIADVRAQGREVLVVSSGAAKWRRSMPVRAAIHSPEVAT